MSVERLRFMAHIKLHCCFFWTKKNGTACKFMYSIRFWDETHTSRISIAAIFIMWMNTKQATLLNKTEKSIFIFLSFYQERLSFLYNVVSGWWRRWNIRKISFKCCRFSRFVIRYPKQKLRWQLVKRNYVVVWSSHIQKRKRQQYNRLYCVLSVTTVTSDSRSSKPPHIVITWKYCYCICIFGWTISIWMIFI